MSHTVDKFLQDFRFGIRILLKSPIFTLVAVITLAAGIGASTCMFSIVNAVLLKPLLLPEPDRLVWLEGSLKSQEWGLGCSGPDFLDWQSQNNIFQYMAAFKTGNLSLTGADEPIQVRVANVSHGFFEATRTIARLGRLPSPSDFKERHQVAVISSQLWLDHFGSDLEVIDKQIHIGGASYSIIGVAPTFFDFPSNSQVWVPLALDDPHARNRNTRSLFAFGRLRDGITLKQAETEMATISGRLQAEYPQTNADRSVILRAFPEWEVRNVRPALLMLSAAVGFVLLISCANVANLLLAKASARRKEIGVRLALGARRSRILRQLITESLIIAGLGGIAGISLAYFGLMGIMKLLPAGDLPRHATVRLDTAVFIFTALVTFTSGMLFGIAPALRGSLINLNNELKSSTSSTSIKHHLFSFQNLLVITELGTAFCLLIGSALMLRTFASLLNTNPGFDPKSVVSLQLPMPQVDATRVPQLKGKYDQMLQKVSQLPGIVSVSQALFIPVGGSNLRSEFRLEGKPEVSNSQLPVAEMRFIGPHYFRTMGVPFLRGRDVQESDNENVPKVAVINRKMAEHFWPGADCIGKHLAFQTAGGDWIWWEIIGVVGDVRDFGLGADIRWEVYMPLAQQSGQDMVFLSRIVPMRFVLRVQQSQSNLLSALKNAIHSVDGNQVVGEFTPLGQLLNNSIARSRFQSSLLALFAAVALIMAIAGVYSLLSWLVARDTKEIGIRVALGASRINIIWLVLRHTLVLSVISLIAGGAMSLLLIKAARSLFSPIENLDAAVLVLMALLLLMAALLASFFPARRASTIGPLEAIRYE